MCVTFKCILSSFHQEGFRLSSIFANYLAHLDSDRPTFGIAETTRTDQLSLPNRLLTTDPNRP